MRALWVLVVVFVGLVSFPLANVIEREAITPFERGQGIVLPDWSARGHLIVFERAEMTGNIWLLDRRREQSDR
jgi:hypothetical protein